MTGQGSPPGLDELARFPLIEALLGRRSRRFPLTELEQLIVATAVGGNTGWHYLNLRTHAEHGERWHGEE